MLRFGVLMILSKFTGNFDDFGRDNDEPGFGKLGENVSREGFFEAVRLDQDEGGLRLLFDFAALF